MNTLSKILSEINNISRKHQIETSINIYKGIELWNKGKDEIRDNNWAQFEKKAGVYCFIKTTTNEVLYIGESSIDVGNRFDSWFLNPKKEKEKEISGNLADDDLIIVVTIEKHKYMVRAVEAYLLSKFETKFNIRS